jgi:hypothetical protein
MFFDQQRAAGIRHGKQRTVDGSLRKHSLNPLTALGQTEQNTGGIIVNLVKKIRRKKGTKVETLTASQYYVYIYLYSWDHDIG